MSNPLLKVAIEATRKEKWFILETSGSLHAMLIGGIVCWWDFGKDEVWLEVNYGRAYACDHLSISAADEKAEKALRNLLHKTLNKARENDKYITWIERARTDNFVALRL